MRKFIVFRTSFEGIHKWPDAPPRVGFLRREHRHIFHVEGKAYVSHGDRDIEFISLKRDVDLWISKRWPLRETASLLGSSSCEMVALEIASAFDLFECCVYEDGENGGGVIAP